MTETKTTVRELIEKLKEFDGDMSVVIPLYDGGYSDIKGVAYNIHIIRNFYKNDLYINRSKGEHKMSDNGEYVVVIE
jgi:hypothetical protein